MEDLIAGIGFILEQGWSFLDGIDVPGLDISFGFFFIGLFLAYLGIRIVCWALGLTGAVSNSDVVPVRIHRFAQSRPKQ